MLMDSPILPVAVGTKRWLSEFYVWFVMVGADFGASV